MMGRAEKQSRGWRFYWPMWAFALLLLICTLTRLFSPELNLRYDNGLPPFSFDDEGRFFLFGTGRYGKALFATSLASGATSLWLGLLTTLGIGMLGVGIGSWMGLQQNKVQRLGVFGFLGILGGLLLGSFYGFVLRKYLIWDAGQEGWGHALGEMCLSLGIFFSLLWLGNKVGKSLDRFSPFHIRFSMGEGMLWLMQVLDSLPRLLLIVSLLAIFRERSLAFVMLLIALTSWTEVALLSRGQVLKHKELPYIEALNMLGYPRWRMFFAHLLPNILPPIAAILALMVGRIIVAEASLGFLGLIDDFKGWGSLLDEARRHLYLPWIGILPGLLLLVSILLIHLIGERFRLFGRK